jgi:PPOX class probable F420-dependent enzyme
VGVQLSEKMQAFVQEPLPALVGTARMNGSVQLNPLWFEYKDGSFWLNGGTNRGWFKHLERDPRITLLLIDPKNMFRWAQIEARLIKWEEDPGGDHINHLSHRYFGRDYQNPRTGRIKIQLEPLRITGSIDGWG